MPSLTLLGMVGPFAIKLATVRLDGVGTSSGSIYAVSTLGSVAGTLFLGFYLFPLLGSREIFIGTGIFLLILSVLIAVFEKKRFAMNMAPLYSISLLVIGLGLLPKIVDAGNIHHANGKFKILSERESLYGWVRVIDQPSRNLRMLTSDASMIGAAGISDGANRHTGAAGPMSATSPCDKECGARRGMRSRTSISPPRCESSVAESPAPRSWGTSTST